MSDPVDPIYWPHPIRYEVSFLAAYQLHEPLVIKFPLMSVIHPDIITNKIKTEVGAMMWARTNTQLPVPKVRACDHKGTMPWNTTRRPFPLVVSCPASTSPLRLGSK